MQSSEDKKGKYTQTHRPHGTLAMLISNSLPPSVPVSLSPSLLRSDAPRRGAGFDCARRHLYTLPLPGCWGGAHAVSFQIARSIKTFSPSLPPRNWPLHWGWELACLDCRDGFEYKKACAQRRGPPEQPWTCLACDRKTRRGCCRRR